jgi:hypothetical protein
MTAPAIDPPEVTPRIRVSVADADASDRASVGPSAVSRVESIVSSQNALPFLEFCDMMGGLGDDTEIPQTRCKKDEHQEHLAQGPQGTRWCGRAAGGRN